MGSEQCFEIDFFPVGEGKRSGDAIAIRFGSEGNYKVLVYDGGTKESGQAVVEHIRKYYGTNRVDYLVNSHPDGDHASGLSVVMEQLEVGELWMHRPWLYSAEIRDYFHDGRITDESLARRMQEKMSAAYQLEELALEANVPIHEPFEGAVIGSVFRALSPSKDWYVHDLIQEFAKSPEQKKMAAATEALSLGGLFKAALDKVTDWIDEKWHVETLRDNVSTSAENESSVVLFGQMDIYGVLLTGDAGIRALDTAANYAERLGINLPASITFAQVPHHGSRNNVSTPVMDRVFGLRGAEYSANHTRTAYVSASKESDTHPRPAVVNAFIRRGYGVFQTKGVSIRHHRGMPSRPGWDGSAPKLEFSDKVQAWS